MAMYALQDSQKPKLKKLKSHREWANLFRREGYSR